MTLNTELGWSVGDDVRVLIAGGLPVGVYQLRQIAQDMNYIAQQSPGVVSPVIDLLDQFDAAQAAFQNLNATSDGRVLTKVDVLEWSVTGSTGSGYSPEREILRIRGLLAQYFASSVLFANSHVGGATPLIRS
jgi:hypothetical protein